MCEKNYYVRKERLRPMQEELSKAIEELKPMIKNYLHDKGIYKKIFRCLNPNHEDKHPSMAFYPESNSIYCFACNTRYDIINLMGIEMGLGPDLHGQDFIKAVKYGCEKYNIPFNYQNEWNPKDYIAECHKRAYQTNYFQKRGITKQTITKFNLGYDPDYPILNKFPAEGPTMKAIIIPTSPYSFTARNTDPDSDIRFRRSNGVTNLFNIETLESDVPVFVTEGEIDALSILDIGPRCIALSGTSNIEKLAEACQKAEFKSTILIALDNDEAGEKNAKKLKELLDKAQIKNKILNLYEPYKDANEFFIKERTKFSLLIGKAVQDAREEEKREKQCEEIKQKCLKLSYEKAEEVSHYIDSIN